MLQLFTGLWIGRVFILKAKKCAGCFYLHSCLITKRGQLVIKCIVCTVVKSYVTIIECIELSFNIESPDILYQDTFNPYLD